MMIVPSWRRSASAPVASLVIAPPFNARLSGTTPMDGWVPSRLLSVWVANS